MLTYELPRHPLGISHVQCVIHMKHNSLTQGILKVTVTEYQGSLLIAVADSRAAAVVLERAINYKARCWIGLHSQQPNGEPYIYAAYPLQLWMATIAS